MISFKRWPSVLFASVLSLALWTFISVNTDLFTDDKVFNGFTYITSYILTVGVWALIALKIKISDRVYKIISVAVFFLTPFFCMRISMLLSGEAEYTFGIYFINVLFYSAILALITAVSRSMRLSSVLTTLIAYVFNLSSFIVNILRGTPLIPSDFLAIGTAAQVAQNYTFHMEYPIIASTVVTAFAVAVMAKFSFRLTFKRKNIIVPSAAAAFALIFFLSMSAVDFSSAGMDVFDQYHANNTHGTIYSFYINVRRMMLNKPEGYNETDVKALLDGETTAKMPDGAPNIIVIMNESFADLSVLGDLQTNTDYMPFVRTMEKNTIKGELLVSPFGGYTCNTEFELLTGLSMGVLPSGSTPYLQYISKPYKLALPSHLSQMGYTSVAVHPYFARCWNRQKVYGLLGFDKFISLENFDDCVDEWDISYVRNYMSDTTSYRALKNLLEEKKAGEKLFLFNVTIQNHGGYDYEGGFTPDVAIENTSGQYKGAQLYLSLVKESDRAFKEFINYLKEYDEPTIVLMFGDHQPAVEQEFFEELYGKPLSQLSPEELQQRYKVPYVIWANYDIESNVGLNTSTNYLSNLLLDAAGIEKSELGDFTEEIRAEIPQINGMGHYDSAGVWHDRTDILSGRLKDYENVGYYLLTRKEKSSK